jgi:hypothetical protein
MKYIFILLLTSLLSNSQNRLSVQIRSCKESESSIEQFSEFSLYKNDSLIENSETDVLGFKQYKNIPEGNYYIIANTFFGKKKSEIISIKKAVNADSFVICVDELDENILNSTNSILDKLMNNEEIKLSYSFGGCFNSGKFEVLIIRKKDKLFLKYNSKTKRLSEKKIFILKKFLKEFENLKDIKPNIICVSSSNSLIEVSHQNQKKSFPFNCYHWPGFQNLEKDLKIKIKSEPLNINTNQI